MTGYIFCWLKKLGINKRITGRHSYSGCHPGGNKETRICVLGSVGRILLVRIEIFSISIVQLSMVRLLTHKITEKAVKMRIVS